MKIRFQILIILFSLNLYTTTSLAQAEEISVAEVASKVTIKNVVLVVPTSYDTITPTVSQKGIQHSMNKIDLLRTQLEMELSNLNTELSREELDYRVARILKVKKEETEADLLFIGKLDKIKKTIAYESLDNSQDYIKTAERFLDTLFNEDTEVSESFKTSTKERYDNYIAKEKVIKIKLNDLIVTELEPRNGESFFKYSAFAILGNYHKQIRVEFYSNGSISRTDPKWIYRAAAEDNILREVTIEGVISDYRYGRKKDKKGVDQKPVSMIELKEWLLVDKDQLIREIKK